MWDKIYAKNISRSTIKYLSSNESYCSFLEKLIISAPKEGIKIEDIIKEYCETNPNEINKFNELGYSPLTYAAYYSNSSIKILCDNGADTNLRNKDKDNVILREWVFTGQINYDNITLLLEYDGYYTSKSNSVSEILENIKMLNIKN